MVPLRDMSQPSLRSVKGNIIPEEFHKIFSRWFDSSAAMPDARPQNLSGEKQVLVCVHVVVLECLHCRVGK